MSKNTKQAGKKVGEKGPTGIGFEPIITSIKIRSHTIRPTCTGSERLELSTAILKTAALPLCDEPKGGRKSQ